MADPLPAFAQILRTVSQLTAQKTDIYDIASRVLQEVKRWGAVRASIQLRLPERSPASVVSLEEPGTSQARFVFSRPIAVRGTRYGLLAVEIDVPKGSPADWMLTLDALSQQLGLMAERIWMLFERDRQAVELAQMREQLQIAKALARAAGLLVRDRHIALDEAKEWITAEAARRGKAVLTIAEQLILQRQLEALWGPRHNRYVSAGLPLDARPGVAA
jgi:hypothetical protein